MASSCCYAVDLTSQPQFTCDFKSTNPDFYEIKKGALVLIEDTGMARVDPLYGKFAGIKTVEINGEHFMYGYFNSIHSELEKLGPSPMGYAYVKRDAMVCLPLESICPTPLKRSTVRR